MHTFTDIKERIKRGVQTRCRKFRTYKWRKQLKNTTFSILSSNCTGGVVAHDFGQQLRSPTINLFFYPDDYIKFLQRPKHYLDSTIVEVDCGCDYPIGKIDDIYIHFLHYDSFAQAVKKWEIRKERINWDNLFVIMTDRDGCTEENIRQFDELPYKNKVIFVSKPCNYQSACYVPNYKGPYYNSYCNIFGSRYYDVFDFLSWFNTYGNSQ